ncbi:MAG: hypothetical protein ABW205_08350 [Burkholderiales bacterium]
METTTYDRGVGSDAMRAAENVIGQAGGSAHGAIDRVSDAARPGVERLASGAHHAVDKIAGYAGQAVDTLNSKSGQLTDTGARLVDAGRDYVRANPMMSVGIGIAAGYVLSRLFTSR